MDGDALVPADDGGRVFSNPLPALLAGLGLITIALALSLVAEGAWIGVPLGLGAIATGVGLAIQPKEWWVMATGCFNFLVAGSAVMLAKADESGIYLFVFAAAAAFLGFLLVLCPPWVRRLAVSLVIVFHFGGICTAVLAAPPQPWVFEWLWVNIYRPYLQFTYLNNAYHFYAPEPGPASLMWYRIEYEPNDDGTRNYRWVKVPNLEDGELIEYDANDRPRRVPRVEHTRRLSLAMSAGQNIQLAPAVLNNLAQQRTIRGGVDRIPSYPVNILPMDRQYREPNSVAKRWIASYARHVALKYKHGTHPEKKVTGVKVYLAEHLYPSPAELGTTHDERGKELAPRKLNDPTHYLPTYLGEFDADGKMKPECFRLEVDGRGNMNKYDVSQRDPYLYWVIPILYHGVATGDSNRSFMYRDVNVDNFMKKHAGDPDWEDQTWENQP
jgi:hypothetical protein